MANYVNRNNFDESAEDIRNDVSQLADTLEEVLKSWGSDAKEEAEAARVRVQSLLKGIRVRLNGHNRVQQTVLDAHQAACDVLGCADTHVRNKPWHSVGAAAAAGVFIGVLLNLRRQQRQRQLLRAPGERKPAGFTESNKDNKYASVSARLWPQGFLMRHRSQLPL